MNNELKMALGVARVPTPLDTFEMLRKKWQRCQPMQKTRTGRLGAEFPLVVGLFRVRHDGRATCADRKILSILLTDKARVVL